VQQTEVLSLGCDVWCWMLCHYSNCNVWILTVPTAICIITKPAWRLAAQTVRYVVATTTDGVTAAVRGLDNDGHENSDVT